MSIRKVISTQYINIVDEAANLVNKLKMPKEGWIRTVRKALGMSGVQLAIRLNVTRSSLFRTEKEELNNTVTLKRMHKIAEAMGCHFIYAIVPEKHIKDLIHQQAKLKATHIVKITNVHMALEKQLLSDDKIQFEINRLTNEIINKNSSDLWDE